MSNRNNRTPVLRKLTSAEQEDRQNRTANDQYAYHVDAENRRENEFNNQPSIQNNLNNHNDQSIPVLQRAFDPNFNTGGRHRRRSRSRRSRSRSKRGRKSRRRRRTRRHRH